MDPKTVKKIREALHGIEVSPTWPDYREIEFLINREIRPPSYIIKLILEILLGDKLPKGMDKSAWELPISFNNHELLVSDWKHYAWSVSGTESALSVINPLIKKFNAAGKIIDSYLEKQAKIHLESGDFSLINKYYDSLSLYESFRDRLKIQLKLANKDKIKGPAGPKRSALFNKYCEALKNSEIFFIATTIFFFAHTEVLFDAFFSLGDRKQLTYRKFRELDWAERFKFFFNVSNDSQIEMLYKSLIEARRFYRNIPVHSSSEYLFPLRGMGLIPATFDNLDQLNMLHGIIFEAEVAKNKLNVFEETLKLFKNHPLTKWGYLYAESGLCIHIKNEFVNDIKSFMTTEEDFQKELHKLVYIQDAIRNGEI